MSHSAENISDRIQQTMRRLTVAHAENEDRPTRSPRAHHVPVWQAVLGFALFCFAIFVLGDLAVELSPENSDVAAWWPAAGVSVAVVTVFYRSRWSLAAGIVIFSALANMSGGRSFAVSLGFSLSNALEALVAAWWLQRSMAGRPVLHVLLDVWRLAVAAVVGAITIGIGAGLTVALLADGSGVNTMLSVIPSHIAAVVLIVPLALSTATVAKRSPIEVGTIGAVTSLTVLYVFGRGQTPPLDFVVVLPLVWASIRLGVRHVAVQLILVGLAVTLLTSHGFGPFAAGAQEQWSSSAMVQLFIIVSAGVLLPLAVAMGERERALSRVLASEELYRHGFKEALVGMLIMRVEPNTLRVVEANQAARRKLGVGHGDHFPSELRDDDFRPLIDIATGLDDDEKGWRGEMNYVTPARDVRRYAVALSKLHGLTGSALITCQIVDVTARYQAELELERQALRDHLTGLPNRVMFDQHLHRQLDVAAETGHPLSVMYIDVDDFKLINDGFGHRAGDKILAEIGRRIATVIRPGDLVARMGGDEFALVCSEAGTPQAAFSLAERVQKIAEEDFVLDDLTYRICLSIGVAFSTDDSTGEGLLGAADIALYAAKADGKRGIRLYSDELGDAASARVRMESELHHAEEEHQFEIYVQPVVQIEGGHIQAAEALIRWNHPSQGLIPPDLWLDVAERSGMMPSLGAWVLDESCRQAATWIHQLGGGVAPAVHVNVSARQLDTPGFADLVLETLDRHSLPPGQLVIELTETYLAEIADYLVSELESLSRLGIQLAADDFGTGYSPLTRITELPVTIIKIDKQFIDPITTDDRARAIVTSLVELADNLGLDVVAEGVETIAQAQMLGDIGCRAAQGYLWSPAVEAHAFQAMLVPGAPDWPTVRAAGLKLAH